MSQISQRVVKVQKKPETINKTQRQNLKDQIIKEAVPFKRVKKRNISTRNQSNHNVRQLANQLRLDIKSPGRERGLRAAAVYFDTPEKDLIKAPPIALLSNHNVTEVKPTM